MFWPRNIKFSFWPLGCVIFDQIRPSLSQKWKVWPKMEFYSCFVLESIAIFIFLNYVLYFSFYGKFGQIWSKITQPRGWNENLMFLGQNYRELIEWWNVKIVCLHLQILPTMVSNFIRVLRSWGVFGFFCFRSWRQLLGPRVTSKFSYNQRECQKFVV